MSEYKRLTKYECGDLIINCKACEYNEEHNIICTDYHCIDALKTRLADLEDKIENGTLIDTKVKIGQRVFRRGFFKGEIDEYIVSNIVLENGKLKFHLKHDFDEGKTCYSATVLDIEEIGKTVFLTKAEAEAKLKELKEV